MHRSLACSFVASAFLVGCGAPEDVGAARQPVVTANALTPEALTDNALTRYPEVSAALTENPLTGVALAKNTLTASALTDPNARTLLQHIVACALPQGELVELEVAGFAQSYEGQIGLAREWGREDGSCDRACQAWVSGCVIARVNHLGQKAPMALRGSHRALIATVEEEQRFSYREATYYGDIFSVPQIRHVCLPPGVRSDKRVCGSSLDGCVVSLVGTCLDACEEPMEDGSYPSCRDRARDPNGQFPYGAVTYPGSVTVFLP
ncbi:MAG: hypothetical protein QM820_64930 [Minicystis sp.]